MKVWLILFLLGLGLTSGAYSSSLTIQNDWDDRDTYSHFGGHGLLQMPNARFGEPGDFAVGWQRIAPYRYVTVSVSPFPWLEGTVRYATQEDRAYALAASLGVTQGNKDKGIDLKLRLIEEDVWLPQVAVGIRDLGGTGLFGSEYLVASKRTGPFDWTFGLGWGLIGTQSDLSNPVKIFGTRFDSRAAQTGQGGTFALDDWFAGENVALFGGISARLPVSGLTAKVELDGNDYSQDASRASISVDSRINYGLVYRLNPYFDLHVGYERGNTLSSGVSMRTQFGRSYQPRKRDPNPSTLPDGQSVDIIPYLENDGFKVDLIDITSRETRLYGEFTRYPDQAQGLGRVALLVAQRYPGTDVSVIESYYGMPLAQWNIEQDAIQRRRDRDLDQHELELSIQRANPSSSERTSRLERGWRLESRIDPDLEQGFQGPEAPWLYRLKVSGMAEARFRDATSLAAQSSISLVDNYDQLVTLDTATMPPVRTEARTYLRENRRFSLDRLQATHFERLSQNIYSQVYAGHLELMFSGYGGEVVYAPFNRSWTVGVDLNKVWKRDYDSLKAVQDYQVMTGHLTGTYNFVDSGISVRTSVGRYLAGDVGLTLDLSRRFENGFQVGVWATKTDVSAAEFGEGSFDKGAYLSIPFDLFTAESTRARGRIAWRPMLRDGGAKLNRMFDLHSLARVRGSDAVIESWERFGQ
jgi:hypothetical protein